MQLKRFLFDKKSLADIGLGILSFAVIYYGLVLIAFEYIAGIEISFYGIVRLQNK